MRDQSWAFALPFALGVLLGCGGDQSCVTTGDCATGVCVAGRCTAPCESNDDCSGAEVCRLGGCVDPELDAGMDAGALFDSGAEEDAGSSDAGSSDAGSSDAGASDAGSSDAGASDAGSSDAGSSDAGSSDAGPLPTDAGRDAGPDAGLDSGPPDAGRPCTTATQLQDCEADEECHPTRLVCAPARACASDRCPPGYVCAHGNQRRCVQAGTGRFDDACTEDSDCLSGACDNSFCGEPCFDDSECTTPDHVCGIRGFGGGCAPCPACAPGTVPLHEPPSVICSCFGSVTLCDVDHPCPGDCQRTSQDNFCVGTDECTNDEIRIGLGGGVFACGLPLGCYVDDPNGCPNPYVCTTLNSTQNFCLR